MKVLNLNINTEQFWINYCDFKTSLQLPLPVDTFGYKCSCNERFYLFKNGDLFLDDEPRMPIPDLMKIEKEKLIVQHRKSGCFGEVTLDRKHGVPECFAMFFKDIFNDRIREFIFDEIEFYPKLMVYSVGQACPAMVLFMNKTSENETMFTDFCL